MTKQLAVWSDTSDVYVVDDGDQKVIVVKPLSKTYILTTNDDYFDKLAELAIGGYKIPNSLFETKGTE